MPTSTPWRDRRTEGQDAVVEALRPLTEDIERLSPEPSLSSLFSNHTYQDNTQHGAETGLLFGLGLSNSAYPKNSYLTPQPDHLYIDQDGGAHIGAKFRSSSKHTHNPEAGTKSKRNGEPRSSKRLPKQRKGKSHTRSGSTIDDLASIAIATSPTFVHDSPNFAFDATARTSDLSRPSTSYINGYHNDDRFDDRPSKRIRSEKLHQTEWAPVDERPRTSHAFQARSSMEDAELLLGLRNGYSFFGATSPGLAEASIVETSTTTEPNLVSVPDAVELKVIEKQAAEPSTEELEPIASEVRNMDSPMDEALKSEDRIEIVQEESASAAERVIPQIQDTDDKFDAEILTEPAKPKDVVDADNQEVPIEPKAPPVKKPRKIKPEIQAEVCATCQKLQRENNDEDTTTHWIGCEYCKKWFHSACQGFRDKSEARAVDKFVCKECEPQHGQTTFVRKSSRVRTAIDYAGLNQGVIKSSEESSMHHYIQPIKDGRIKYLPDDFARVRPELLTAEWWENMDNMKRPFVVPACWNPRFGVPSSTADNEADSLHAQPLDDASFVTYNDHGDVIQHIPAADRPDVQIDQATEDTVLECDQDYLDMVMPRHLTVRKVSELYGSEQPVPVIDVKSQETKGQWTLNDWANYYEQQGEKPIRNVISLEVSNSPIGKLIRRPKAVRDIDLEDQVWDNETRSSSNKRPVQFYCLMSVADSYTDFHIDFGGSSVYYHILKGVKTFFFIPPEDKYLKEYEKWCNSDTQNDTWLGDLCNGNVTRVDLHEGDTAFIPAGWIHSVWTPEDSLVIGGNFLTRLDYDLQLKVANVEKITRVPQKFRYPFFQKVMWYTLLKYLDDDPVPEEVLRDFHADEEYRYLRANPAWYEFDELASDAEPGEPGHHARLYPKSELKGLPALRDYLYRTACIHADIPVADINKKQIDAVKASIPKGHGDPMRLIKTFAVWCAWKIGNETVPKWVHDQGDGLVTEIKEREKAKEETFRVPPERVSARHASKTKASSPAVEVLSTPVKSAISLDSWESSSTKSRSGSRGGSLRVACDACRKRRIKCRHKEGDDTIANASPPEIRPRTYSNVSVDIPKLASASPANSTFEQSTAVNGVPQDFNNTSDLAHAALASLHSQSSDPVQLIASTSPGSSTKKGRSKACEECRKSKRRCVHDEYGRIDPAKAAEPSKPRGSATSKRQSRLSDEYPAKRHKADSDAGAETEVDNITDIDMMIDPALINEGLSIDVIHPPTETLVMRDETDVAMLESTPPIDPLLGKAGVSVDREDGYTVPQDGHVEDENENTNINHFKNSVNGEPDFVVAGLHGQESPDVDISYSPITVDGVVTETTERVEVKMEEGDAATSNSRHSSRQAKQVERYVPEEHRSPSKVGLKATRDPSASSSSDHTVDASAKGRRSSSNTSGTTHRAMAMKMERRQSQEAVVRPISRGSSAESETDADEKLARELQAAENGLRRRASMRA